MLANSIILALSRCDTLRHTFKHLLVRAFANNVHDTNYRKWCNGWRSQFMDSYIVYSWYCILKPVHFKKIYKVAYSDFHSRCANNWSNNLNFLKINGEFICKILTPCVKFLEYGKIPTLHKTIKCKVGKGFTIIFKAILTHCKEWEFTRNYKIMHWELGLCAQ